MLLTAEMNVVKELIDNYGIITWALMTLAIILLLLKIVDIVKKLASTFGIELAGKRKTEEKTKLLDTHTNQIKDLSTNVEELSKKVELIDQTFKTQANSYAAKLDSIENSIKDLGKNFEKETDIIKSEIKLIKSDLRVNSVATVESLYDIINRKCRFYMRQNGVPEDERERFIKLCESYTACGGNHGLQDRIDACLKLPRILDDDVIGKPRI